MQRSLTNLFSVAARTVVVASLALLQTMPASTALAAVVRAPVLVDDFGGNHLGTRTVTTSNGGGTSAAGTFSEAAGLATMTLSGAGNSVGSVQLDYANIPNVDLTAGGNNGQFYVEMPSIVRSNENPGDTAVSISIIVTDAAGHQGTTGSTGMGSVPAGMNIATELCNKSQAAPGTVCFSNSGGLIDFTKITHVSLLYMYPGNYNPGHVTTVVLDAVRTTPTAGGPSAPPSPSVTLPGGLLVSGPPGTPVVFQVTFSAWGALALITRSLILDQSMISGSAPGAKTLTLAGGPALYTVTVNGITGDGTVALKIPAQAVTDDWGQYNIPSSNEDVATVRIVVSPTISSATGTTFFAGTSNTFHVVAGGNPAPTVTEIGALPSGVSFDGPTQILSGAPAAGTGGTYNLTFKAANGVGSNATQVFALLVKQAPLFTSPDHTTLQVGQPSTFSFTATGSPAPQFSVLESLPGGLHLNTQTGALAGTPLPGSSGAYTLTVKAANGVVSDASRTFVLTIDEAPAITSPASTTMTVGLPATFKVTTTGFPAPTLTQAGELPVGVLFDAATGTFSGTPAAGGHAHYAIILTATSGSLPVGLQSFTLSVLESPAITSADHIAFPLGQPGTFTVTAAGLPAPTLSVTGALPAGVTFDTPTGMLSGTPAATAGGTYQRWRRRVVCRVG